MKRCNNLAIILILLTSSCRKYVDVGLPPTQLVSASVFESDATATAAQLHIYAQMEADGLMNTLLTYTGISGDELTNYSSTPARVELATNNITTVNTSVNSLWTSFYKYNYMANAVIEGLSGSNGVSTEVNKQLTAEAKFIRAFCHFYLAQLFDDIPVVTTTEFQLTASLSRQPLADVYMQIEKDLMEAAADLSMDYLDAGYKITSERVRPNRAAANALLARVYLFRQDWATAEAQATSVISLSNSYSLEDLNSAFTKNNSEAIWQLMAVVPGFNSFSGAVLPLYGTPTDVAIAPGLLNSFEPGDARPGAWLDSITSGGTTYYYPYKYKVGQNAPAVTEYTMVIRLAELFLIRAEARARQGNLTGAVDDLNSIRSRAQLLPTTASTSGEILSAVSAERKMELFAEAADRWIDLKRTGKVDEVLQPIKGTNWTTTDQHYPVPQTEINRNRNLTQNPGY